MQTKEKSLSENMERILPLVDAFQKLPDVRQGMVLGYAIGLNDSKALDDTTDGGDKR